MAAGANNVIVFTIDTISMETNNEVVTRIGMRRECEFHSRGQYRFRRRRQLRPKTKPRCRAANNANNSERSIGLKVET